MTPSAFVRLELGASSLRAVHVLVTVSLLAVSASALLAGPSQATAPGFAYAVYPAPGALGQGAAEPSLGVDLATGVVLAQNFATTVRADFDDSTLPASVSWRDVTPPNSIINVDPMLATDRATGRTFAGGLDGECSIMSFTDDNGATWTPMGNACASPAFDHQTIGAGPWMGGNPLGANAPYPNLVYYCAQLTVIQCATSANGGLTFGPATVVNTGFTCAGLHGSVEVGANGVAWLPVRACGSQMGMYVSRSNGLTWTGYRFPGTAPANGFDPEIATTPSGWAYIGYMGENGHPLVTLTKRADLVSFTPPVDVGASLGVQSTAFMEMVAGDDQRAAAVFVATPDAGAAFEEGFTGVWHLYVATTLDAGATWTTVQVTGDPVQRGFICDGGIGCGSGRNLLDFIDATVDADGRVLVAFADGCVANCALSTGTAGMSTSDQLTLVRQACGPSLFAAKGDVEGGQPCSVAVPTLPRDVPGTLYARSLVPVGNAHLVVSTGDTLTASPPGGDAPKTFLDVPGLGSNGQPGFYDAAFYGAFPGSDVDGTVTARVWVTSGGLGTLSVALYDSAFSQAATEPLLRASIPTPLAPGPQEVVIPLGSLTRTLENGLTLVIRVVGQGGTTVYYDSAQTPTRIEIS